MNNFNYNNRSGKIFTKEFIKIIFMAIFTSMIAQLQATTFPLYVQDLGGNLTMAGLMTSVYMGTSALCKPFVGSLLNKNPRKKLFFIAGIVFACILSSFGFLNVIVVIMIVRAINAPFYSVFSTSSMTMGTDFIPDDRMVEGIGYYNLSSTISQAFAASIALFVINKFGYKYLFFTCSAFAIIAMLIGTTIKYDDPTIRKAQYLKEHPEEVEKETTVKKIKFSEKVKMLFTTPILFPCIMMFFFHIGASGVVTYLPTWGKTVGMAGIGSFFTVQAITLALSRMFVGKISKKLGSTWTLFIGFICVEVCMFSIKYCTSLTQIMVLGLFLGAASGLTAPTIHAIVLMLAPADQRGMANAVYAMSSEVGACTCSLVLGILATKFGINNVFTFAGLFPIVSFAVLMLKVRTQIKELKI